MEATPQPNSSSLPLEISPLEAQRQIATGGAAVRLIDVRDDEEFAFNHLPGAQHIALSTLGREAPAKLEDRSADILLYCHHGMRSAHAAEFLRQQGYSKARSIAGGIDQWAAEIDSTIPRY